MYTLLDNRIREANSNGKWKSSQTLEMNMVDKAMTFSEVKSISVNITISSFNCKTIVFGSNF